MKCDKCGQYVTLSNDAVSLDCILHYGHLPTGVLRLQYGARHLFPVGACEGSPSRVQFLGGTRDSRGYGDSLTPDQWAEYEARVRAAYEVLQKGNG